MALLAAARARRPLRLPARAHAADCSAQHDPDYDLLRLCLACDGSAGCLQQGGRGALQAVKGGSRSRYGSSSVPCRPRRVTCPGCLAGSPATCRKSGVATQITIAAHIFLLVPRAAMRPAHTQSHVNFACATDAPQSELLEAFTGRQQECRLLVRGAVTCSVRL